MDRNSYYGGESASLNLKQLWERFRPGEPEPTQYGRWQDWNFDMVPKFMVWAFTARHSRLPAVAVVSHPPPPPPQKKKNMNTEHRVPTPEPSLAPSSFQVPSLDSRRPSSLLSFAFDTARRRRRPHGPYRPDGQRPVGQTAGPHQRPQLHSVQSSGWLLRRQGWQDVQGEEKAKE